MDMRINAEGMAAATALLLAIIIAAWGMEPPPVRPADAPSATGVQLPRMLDDLRVISREPHVTGSPANARVRDYLIARFETDGLTTSIQRGTAVRQSARGTRPIATAPVENVIAVLPGRDRGQPAIAVMAHYDSVPFSHGAGDDGAGVVSVLETARTLAGGPPPARDVVFLLTDGEEIGLLGAQLFFTEHPLARRIGMVVNAEARGAKGRATMFQTSSGDRDLVALWAAHAISPSGNSLAGTVYRLLPNDTDLSVPLDKGIAGINAAFTGGHFDYHSTTDRYEHIDRRSLQHLGDFTLTTTRALAMADALPGRLEDSVYFDVLGRHVVRYPMWVGWIMLTIAIAGWVLLVRRDNDLAAQALIRSTVATLVATAVLGGLLHGVGAWMTGKGATAFREMMAEEAELLLPLGLLVLAAWLLMRPTRASVFGAIGVLIIAALAAQIWLPGGGFLFVWPALAGLFLMATSRPRGGLVLIVRAAVAAIVLGIVLQLVATAWVSVGLLSAGVIAMSLPFAIALVGPLLAPAPWQDPPRRGRVAHSAGIVALIAGAAGVGILAASDGFSPRQPRPGDFFALFDSAAGRHYWATTSDPAMLPDGQPLVYGNDAFPRFRPHAVAAGERPAPDAARLPEIAASTAPDGRRLLTIRTSGPPRSLTIAVKVNGAASDTRVNGRPVTLSSNGWTTIQYRAQQPAAIIISTRTDAAQPFVIRYLLATPGLPENAPRSAGLATNWAILTGTQVVVGEWPGTPR